MLADLAMLLEVFAACSDVFRSESQVADVEGAALSLVSHHAAVTKDVFVVTLIAAGGVGPAPRSLLAGDPQLLGGVRF